jgi:glycosyltransferase involved in cell wall biosynthesis
VLSALRQQVCPPDEIICVDDNSTFSEATQTRRLARAYNAVYIDLPRLAQHCGRRSAARNAGTLVARSDLVLYLDSDMVVGPGYLASIRWYHYLNTMVLLKGTRIDFPNGRLSNMLPESAPAPGMALQPWGEYSSPKSRYSHEHPITALKRQQTDRLHSSTANLDDLQLAFDRWDWCASNNLSVRRHYVLAAGGWDENFHGWGEEDMEFSYRMFLLGLRPVIQVSGPIFAVHVEHSVDREANQHSLARNAAYFSRKFPETAAFRMDAYRDYGLDVSRMVVHP